jgi:hypothetical protein
VVNVLGLGVTTSELTEALVRLKIPYPFNVRSERVLLVYCVADAFALPAGCR